MASFRAMGTVVSVSAADDRGIEATRLVFAEAERRFSRFLPDSELSHLNCGPQSAQVSPQLADVLHIAADLKSRTQGLVDPGIGHAVAGWGYDRSFEHVRDGRPVPGELAAPAWRIDGLDVWRGAGVALDLGGIAKGWTVDRAIEAGVASIVSAGGDVRSADAEATVDIVDPWGDIVAAVELGTGALATSSITRRRWATSAGDAHHLIDPRRMAPSAGPVLSATAICTTAVEAEAAAKATLLLGAGGLAWADAQPWIAGALVVWADGSVYSTTGVAVAA